MIATDTYQQYALMSGIFRYPTATSKEEAVKVSAMLEADYPEGAKAFKRYLDWVLTTPQQEIEEVFAKTFHVQAIAYLDIGYVIFGEDYKRGEFLVNMKAEQEAAKNDCGEELPDNLANILTLLPKLEDEQLRDDLTGRIMIPAIRKMLKEFEDSRIKMKERILKKKHKALIMENMEFGNIYRNALEGLLAMLTTDFNEVAMVDAKPKVDPLSAPAPVATCGSCGIPTTPNKTQKS